MNVEEITLKRLKSENEYLEQIYVKHLKKTYESVEERYSMYDKQYDEAVSIVKYEFSEEELKNSKGIIRDIYQQQLLNSTYRYMVKKYVLETEDANAVIEIDNLIRGKVAAKNVGKTGLKVGKFLGRKVKEGAVNLYNNRDEIIGNAVNKVSEKQEKMDNDINRYMNRYSNCSEAELKDIITDEGNSYNKRKAAKNVYEDKY